MKESLKIKSQIDFEQQQIIYIEGDESNKSLFLYERDEEKEEGEEPEYLFIQIADDKININGHMVSKRIAEEIVKFLIH